jgi:hypothetical protein
MQLEGAAGSESCALLLVPRAVAHGHDDAARPLSSADSCKAPLMGIRPRSRRAACREEPCVRLGYCGGDDRWLTASDLDGETADAVVDAVLVVEGLDPATVDSSQRAQIMAIVDDWLFAPYGRGQRSGLPR